MAKLVSSSCRRRIRARTVAVRWSQYHTVMFRETLTSMSFWAEGRPSIERTTMLALMPRARVLPLEVLIPAPSHLQCGSDQDEWVGGRALPEVCEQQHAQCVFSPHAPPFVPAHDKVLGILTAAEPVEKHGTVLTGIDVDHLQRYDTGSAFAGPRSGSSACTGVVVLDGGDDDDDENIRDAVRYNFAMGADEVRPEEPPCEAVDHLQCRDAGLAIPEPRFGSPTCTGVVSKGGDIYDEVIRDAVSYSFATGTHDVKSEAQCDEVDQLQFRDTSLVCVGPRFGSPACTGVVSKGSDDDDEFACDSRFSSDIFEDVLHEIAIARCLTTPEPSGLVPAPSPMLVSAGGLDPMMLENRATRLASALRPGDADFLQRVRKDMICMARGVRCIKDLASAWESRLCVACTSADSLKYKEAITMAFECDNLGVA